MIPEPVQLRQMAETKTHENFKFRHFLKHHPSLASEEIDKVVFQIAEQVWKRVDCTACGNCCREVATTMNEKEVGRLAMHLRVSNEEFTSKYLEPAEPSDENPWVTRKQPCPFLKDNRCTVYDSRPSNCRDYPYLHKPDFTARTLSMLGRLSECPAAFEVWEELKRATGFRLRRRREGNPRWHTPV